MTVKLDDDGAITLVGACPIEDAEVLLGFLLSNPEATIDWRACEGAHTAVVQVLMAAGRRPRGSPRDVFLAGFVAPAIAAAEA